MNTKLKAIFFGLFIFLATDAQSQQHGDSAAHTLSFKKTFISTFKYYKDNIRVTKKEVNTLLNQSDASNLLFKKYKKLQVQAAIIMIPSMAILCYAGVQVLTKGAVTAIFSPNEPYRTTTAETIMLVTGTAGSIFSIIQEKRGRAFFEKAIQAYNGQTKLSFQIGVTRSGNIGFVINF